MTAVMAVQLSILSLLILCTLASSSGPEYNCSLTVTYPTIILSNVPFYFTVDLPAFLEENISIPITVDVNLYQNDTLLYHTTVSTSGVNTVSHLYESTLEHRLGPAPDKNHTLYLGYHSLDITILNTEGEVICQDEQVVLAVPSWLTIFPPIITAIVAIAFRQVLLALLIGVWLGAFLAQEYNLFTALLRTLDTYIVNAMAEFDHAEIIIGTFFLGGLIGLVQKSGGGLGLARVFSRFAKTNRRASLVCVGIALLIFFDDYTSVLITGTSLRTIMDSSGVSKDKFSFIVQSMAPTMASFVPVSSWIGAQIGYTASGFDSCSENKDKPFNIVIDSLPYRFLPVLMLYCVFLVCILNRDFACMLTSERNIYQLHQTFGSPRSTVSPPSDHDSGDEANEDDKFELHRSSDVSQSNDLEDLFEGPLAPKKGVPYRWFNAVIPFLIVIIFTFVGMILDGWWTIKVNNEDFTKEHIDMTVTNIFGNADAMAAVIWSSCLATFVIIVMVMIQRILNFTEVMTTWVEGVKDVLEPLFILILAWALGAVISEIQTSSFIAEVIRSGNMSVDYIPVITTIIGYFMAYCTGSAFGTMGILFPLVIPTVCQLAPNDRDIQVQTAAAILSSCIFGNLMSPIADLTVLTRVSTQCDLNSHIKSCSPYVLLVGFITIIFGALPVGAKWYPWYAAWIIMPVVLTVVFVIISTGHSSTSRSLFKRGCPCIYVLFDKLYFKAAAKLNPLKVKYSGKLHSLLHRRRSRRRSLDNADGVNSTAYTVDEESETAPIANDSPSEVTSYHSLMDS